MPATGTHSLATIHNMGKSIYLVVALLIMINPGHCLPKPETNIHIHLDGLAELGGSSSFKEESNTAGNDNQATAATASKTTFSSS